MCSTSLKARPVTSESRRLEYEWLWDDHMSETVSSLRVHSSFSLQVHGREPRARGRQVRASDREARVLLHDVGQGHYISKTRANQPQTQLWAKHLKEAETCSRNMMFWAAFGVRYRHDVHVHIVKLIHPTTCTTLSTEVDTIENTE